jgi:hypothetical protein
MYLVIKNENYGYGVATYGDYVAVSNPAITRYDPTSGLFQTGSVDYYRYNKSGDEHNLIGQLYLSASTLNILLASETGSDPSLRDPLHTELNNTGSSFNRDIEIDKNLYTASLEDGFGLSLDIYNKILVVGSPYATQASQTSASLISASIAGVVNIFDLGISELSTFNTSSTVFAFAIENPDSEFKESFGRSVSINSSWLAVGSPLVSGSDGRVYIYQNLSSGSNYDWQLFQTISSSTSNLMFGGSLKLNKQTGSYSGSLVVGCGNSGSNQAFYFEFVSGSWNQTYIFNSDLVTQYPLTFGNFNPYSSSMNITNAYGYSVSTFGTTVVIGEYLDRTVYEFSGSLAYQQGSVSIYEKCSSPPTKFQLVLKTYGSSSILKNNFLGFSVDVSNGNVIAGIPKINPIGFSNTIGDGVSSCFIGGTLQQLHQCPDSPENTLSGQAMLLQKNTSSGYWGITNIYQKKKRFLSPYREFGNSVAINGRSMVVGAPIILSDTNREINIDITQSNSSVLDDVSGKAYIYNMANLSNEFHIGNVFYRNGKLVVITSGSIFDNLFTAESSNNDYRYDLFFQGQHTIFEKQVICSVNPGEFNVSTNPTAIIRATSSLDINGNGFFDFQDMDVILRYMQFKNTILLGENISTDWSSSVVLTDDEKSVLRYYQSLPNYNANHTSFLTSESIQRFETTDTWIQNAIDFNQDNKIDIRDMNILWKYFTNRLTQTNYSKFVTPASQIKIFSDVLDNLNHWTQKDSLPQIDSSFLNYDTSVSTDKTGSFLAPVATSVGLYSGLDLIAVAKLGTPIKITPELPLNIIIKIDF